MRLRFNKVRLVNFGSYTDTTLTLTDKNFCLVSGKNKFKKDNALSNGSGKSTLWTAICWALTGETLTGLHTGLKNINNEDQSSYVSLEFSVDSDLFIVTRVLSPKSDLKIFKNAEEISGKGIRESEKILAETLPDITKDLLASTILLGQGLPNRFSSFTPSGRKDLLETLTKSDFMIEDIKSRLTARRSELNEELRKYEDSLLANNTQLSFLQTQLNKATADLQSSSKIDYTNLIEQLTKKVTDTTDQITALNKDVSAEEAAIEVINSTIMTLVENKAKENEAELTSFSTAQADCTIQLKTNNIEIERLENEISKLKAIVDTCPTCGQKIPGVFKTDTSKQEEELDTLRTTNSVLTARLAEIEQKHRDYIAQIESRYAELAISQQSLQEKKHYISLKRDELAKLTVTSTAINKELDKALYDQQNLKNIIKSLTSTVDGLNTSIATTCSAISLLLKAKDAVLERIEVNKKMDTLSKREFRGYLLYNIIDYLNIKVKEYASIVFGTEDLSIYLSNNALDISYCQKLYESLSGGEKQRVDLITQFAIRDLLQKYFNYSSNILVLDEITDNLDKVATARIFDLIISKLSDVESLFIISHHADELEIPIDSSIRVIKDSFGNSYIQEA